MRKILGLTLALAGMAAAATETLQYTVNWPTGLSLGEAKMSSDNVGGASGARKLEFVLEASIPGFAVRDEVRSLVGADYCATELNLKLKHGAKVREEQMVFRPAEGTVERKTARGGTSKLPLQGCGRDALGMIYHLRSELQQGRIPAAQTVYFGAGYQVSFKYAGTMSIAVGGAKEPADKLEVTIQGPAARHLIEVYYGRDAARTPVLFRVPLVLGAFTMELQR